MSLSPFLGNPLRQGGLLKVPPTSSDNHERGFSRIDRRTEIISPGLVVLIRFLEKIFACSVLPYRETGRQELLEAFCWSCRQSSIESGALCAIARREIVFRNSGGRCPNELCYDFR